MKKKKCRLDGASISRNCFYFESGDKILGYFCYMFSSIGDYLIFLNIIQNISYKFPKLAVYDSDAGLIYTFLKMDWKNVSIFNHLRQELEILTKKIPIEDIEMSPSQIHNHVFTFFPDIESQEYDIMRDKKKIRITHKKSGMVDTLSKYKGGSNSSNLEIWENIIRFTKSLQFKIYIFLKIFPEGVVSYNIYMSNSNNSAFLKLEKYISDLHVSDMISTVKINLFEMIGLIKKTKNKFLNQSSLNNFTNFLELCKIRPPTENNSESLNEMSDICQSSQQVPNVNQIRKEICRYLDNHQLKFTTAKKNLIIIPKTGSIILIIGSIDFKDIYSLIKDYYQSQVTLVITIADEMVNKINCDLPNLCKLKKLFLLPFSKINKLDELTNRDKDLELLVMH